MMSYYTRVQAHHLDPLVHAHCSHNLEHVVIKVRFKELISFLMDREAKAPKGERRSVDQELMETVRVLREPKIDLF